MPWSKCSPAAPQGIMGQVRPLSLLLAGAFSPPPATGTPDMFFSLPLPQKRACGYRREGGAAGLVSPVQPAGPKQPRVQCGAGARKDRRTSGSYPHERGLCSEQDNFISPPHLRLSEVWMEPLVLILVSLKKNKSTQLEVKALIFMRRECNCSQFNAELGCG